MGKINYNVLAKTAKNGKIEYCQHNETFYITNGYIAVFGEYSQEFLEEALKLKAKQSDFYEKVESRVSQSCKESLLETGVEFENYKYFATRNKNNTEIIKINKDFLKIFGKNKPQISFGNTYKDGALFLVENKFILILPVAYTRKDMSELENYLIMTLKNHF